MDILSAISEMSQEKVEMKIVAVIGCPKGRGNTFIKFDPPIMNCAFRVMIDMPCVTLGVWIVEKKERALWPELIKSNL